MQFKQIDEETIGGAWFRFKEMLRLCPGHAIPTEIQLECFYKGLDPNMRMRIDMSAGGVLMSKTEEEAFKLIDDMVYNCRQWEDETVMQPNTLKAEAERINKQQVITVNAIHTSVDISNLHESAAQPVVTMEQAIANLCKKTEMLKSKTKLFMDEAKTTMKEQTQLIQDLRDQLRVSTVVPIQPLESV